MARSELGAGVTELYYRRTRLLSLALAILLRAIWEAMNLSTGKSIPARVVNSWLEQAAHIIEEFHELSLAMAQDYFVSFVAVDAPETKLRPQGQQRAVWSAMDVNLSDDIESLSRVLLEGRIGQVPDAARRVLESTVSSVEHEVGDLAELAGVMGGDWAEFESEPGQDPYVLLPDPNPLVESNVRNRMLWKGPKSFEKGAAKIDALTRAQGDESLAEVKKIRVEKQSDRAWVRSTNSAVTLADAGQDFVRAATAAHQMGYVRVLGPNPCAFCVMLAAQGVVYEEGAWDESNAKYRTWTSSTGEVMQGGEAKVHDGCQCRLEPVPMVGDVVLPQSVRHAQSLWEEATGRMFNMSWADKVKLFRRAYHDGELDRDLIEQVERDRLTTERDALRMEIPYLMIQLAHTDAWEEESGIDKSHAKDFFREQLEYRLQRWAKRGYGETDWSEEYQWCLERAAAVFDPDGWEYNKQTWEEVLAKSPDDDLLKEAYHYQEWVRAQAPEAWRNATDYWPSYQGPVVDESIMFAHPGMPEFR